MPISKRPSTKSGAAALPARRARRRHYRSLFEGSAAAAGKAPFGTTARKVEGGWLVNGRKIFASLSGAADYYGVLCTEDKGDEKPDARDTLYLAVPATSEGFSISGDWNPLGMRGTVSRNLLFKDVFVSDDEQLMPRGVYFKGAQTWPAMFFSWRRPPWAGNPYASRSLHRKCRSAGERRSSAACIPKQVAWRRMLISSSYACFSARVLGAAESVQG